MRQAPPIIMPVPVHTKRDCIVVDSKTYCREQDVTKREFGIALLTIALLAAWVVFVIIKAMDARDGTPWLVGGLAIPFLVFCGWLILS